ncbi:MAG: hypothetical protein HQ519_03450 [Planctomycetes bacterium]|nr:hypothetical protein [Planctomycetota bacterium]
MAEFDPLDPLRDAWQQVEAPQADRELSDEDAATQEAVQWMASAWQQVPIPEFRSEQKPKSKPLLWRRLALAAAALLIATLSWPESEIADNQTKEIVAPPPPPAPATPRARLIANDEEKIEILSGKVRLTMLRGPVASPDTDSTDY